MSCAELVSLIASIVSLVLGLGAIWLSIVFFKMSSEASSATTEAAKGIDASIKRLENLFDKLYSDTFSMMKDTVSDMRKHIWNGGTADQVLDKDCILEEADRKAEEKVAEVKRAMETQLSEILARQRVSDGNVSGFKHEMKRLLESAIQTSRQIDSEAREETLREHILVALRKAMRSQKTMTALEIVKSLSETVPTHRVVLELTTMKSEGLIAYDDENVVPETRIRIPSIREPSDREAG